MATANATVSTCKTMPASSNGAWQGDNPIHFALPLLIIQICIVLTITRVLAALFKPLKQPRVIAEVVGGILLGPSALGKNAAFISNIFPKQSVIILEVFAQMGLVFFLFMVGLELDIRQIRKTGFQAMVISAAGIAVPFSCGVGVSFVLHQTIAGDVKFGPFVVFMGVAMSITAFPVLARILAERKLLTTEVGQLAMSVAAVDDVMAWVLLALAVALSGANTKPTVVVWVLLSGIAFVITMFVAIQPVMKWVATRSADNEPVKELLVCLTFAGVLVAAFTTDAIGIHAIFGAFLFGLIVPKEGPFAAALVEKIEDFISILMLPLYFASSGLKTNIGTIKTAQSFGLLVLVISVACFGKMCGTFLAATASKVNPRKALTLGVLMNTKGLVELIVLNIGKDRKVLNEETFAIMVLMALFTTFMTTPLVMALYKPARNPVPYNRRKLALEDSKDDLRILSCVHGMKNVPAMINLTEGTRGIRKRALRLYILHLMELSERTSAIMIVQRARKDGRPFFNQRKSAESRDQIVAAFETYGQLSKVTVRPMTAISNFEDMHEDICATATGKRVAMIVLPFHKTQRLDGQFDSSAPGFRHVNQKVLQHAPCSVAILIDRGVGGSAQVAPNNVDHKVAVYFFGGQDDREALAYGLRMAEHPGIQLHVIRFLNSNIDTTIQIDGQRSESLSSSKHHHFSPGRGYHFAIAGLDQDQERMLDEAALDAVRRGEKGKVDADEVLSKVTLQECRVADPYEAVVQAAKEGGHNIILVGRSRRPTAFVASTVHHHPEYTELGPIGEALLAPEVRASVLVFQQYDPFLDPDAMKAEKPAHHV